jgi:hypothetical protein
MLNEWKRRNFQNKYYGHHRTGEEREDKDEAGQKAHEKNEEQCNDRRQWRINIGRCLRKLKKTRKCLSLVS